MSRLALLIARFASSAWVGAAVLFVVNGVRQATSGQFDSLTTDQLVVLRFPAYYVMGFCLVGAAWVGSAFCGEHLSFRHRGIVLGLFGLALVVMLFDYLVVYVPLVEMITPPGKARPQGFQTLHQWSKDINSVDVGLVLLGSWLVCWPARVARAGEGAVK